MDPQEQISGLVQERSISSTLAMELRLSCTNPSKWGLGVPEASIKLVIFPPPHTHTHTHQIASKVTSKLMSHEDLNNVQLKCPFYTPSNEVSGGILDSPCLSVCLSVR